MNEDWKAEAELLRAQLIKCTKAMRTVSDALREEHEGSWEIDLAGLLETARSEALDVTETRTLSALSDELSRARRKFPSSKKLLAALVEEVGELAQAMLKDEPKERVVAEAIQVACVAVRIAEEGDADFMNKDWGPERQ